MELDVSTLNVVFSSIRSSTLREIARTTEKLCACIYLVWRREGCDEGGVRGGPKKSRECEEESGVRRRVREEECIGMGNGVNRR